MSIDTSSGQLINPVASISEYQDLSDWTVIFPMNSQRAGFWDGC